MKTSTLLKFCTFFLFLLLIGIFISYRSGAFSKDEDVVPLSLNPIDTSGRGKPSKPDTLSSAGSDSLIKMAMDSMKRDMMWSSKSVMVVTPDHRAYKAKAKKEARKRRRAMKESSKFGRIFRPDDTVAIKSDTAVLIKKQ